MKNLIFLLTCIFVILSFSCKKESSKNADLETSLLFQSEVDVKKIENLLGIRFTILKTETHGYKPVHKFCWVCLEEKVDQEKVRELAREIVNSLIAEKPSTYHSFTIHFFWRDDIKGSVEESKSFAQAAFLPEGGWLKVGRVPIDDYKDYKLKYTVFE